MLIPWLPSYPDPWNVFAVALIALAIDTAIGDPAWLYRYVPHPVAALGRFIAALEKSWNDPRAEDFLRVGRGAACVALVVTATFAITWALAFALRQVSAGWIIEAILASTLIAFRGLHDHVRAVAVALDGSLAAGREQVAKIVGRDPDSLDEAGVARAAIESAAENFADGTVAPVFWFIVGGLPGLAIYKAVNTLDSMIGHRSLRYAAFGRTAARLDDVMNWIPARLAGCAIVLAAAAAPGASPAGAWRAMRRDARKHLSPNAGWPESAMAGALALALAGPRRYGDDIVEDAWLGDGRRDAGTGDIRRALVLYAIAGAVLAAVLAAAFLLR